MRDEQHARKPRQPWSQHDVPAMTESGAITSSARATGAIRTPASRALNPSTNCRYWVMRKNIPTRRRARAPGRRWPRCSDGWRRTAAAAWDGRSALPDDEGGDRLRRRTRAPTIDRRGPTSTRRFDDPPQQQPEPEDGQPGTHRVGAARGGVLRVGHQPDRRRPARPGHDGHVDQEHRSPPEVGQQEPAQDRAERHPEPGRSRPDADGPDPVPFGGEDIGEDRERARHEGGSAHAHDGPGQRQAVRGSRPGGERRSAAEDDQAGHEDPLPADPVAQRPEREQEAGEDHGVGVDHPLQLAGGGADTPHDRGQGHIEDGVVQADEEQGDAEHGQRGPAVVCTGFGLRPARHRLAPSQ